MEQFSCSNYEQKRNYKDLLAEGKKDPPPPPPGLIELSYSQQISR